MAMLQQASENLNRIFEIYEAWPENFKHASSMDIKLDHSADYYDAVVLGGMGGSGTSCDILENLMNHDGIVSPIVVKENRVPPHVNNHSLVIINSVSGNTEEALAMLTSASAKSAEIICISSGKKLKELSEAYGHKHITIPDIFLPRAALPYLIVPGLMIADKFLKTSIAEEIPSISESMALVGEKISRDALDEFNISKRIALFMQTGYAFCFSSPLLTSVATRFKNSLNENAKVHCVRESILEASHNEIVPFSFDNNSFNRTVLTLKWISDNEMVKQRFAKVEHFFKTINQRSIELVASETSLVKAILSSIYVLDYATIYLSILRGIDPCPTPAIDILKG